MNVGYFWKMWEILLNRINAIIRDIQESPDQCERRAQ